MHEQYIASANNSIWGGTGATQLAWSNNSTASMDIYASASTSNPSANWDYIQTAATGMIFTRMWKFFEQTNQQIFEPYRIFAEAGQKWIQAHGHELIHEPQNFIYVPGQDIEEMLANQNEQLDDVQRKAFATQHLAPICEAIEIEGYKRVMDHLEKLLNDEAYRTFQLTEINKVNKILGLKECVWNAQAVLNKIQDIKFEHNPRKAWTTRGMQFIHKEAEKRAEELFNEVFTTEEVMKLNMDKRLIITRDGLMFELLPNGGINQLLPDGQKQGWCLVSKEYGLPLKDILVMKKLILDSAPEIVLQVANKCSAFN